jgi:hypothetical protein
MTGRKSNRQSPRARRSNSEKRQAAAAGKSARPHKKPMSADKAATDQKPQKSAARSKTAAPLLAHTLKKVGALDRSSPAKKAPADASYQPKTQAPASRVGAPQAAIDVMALAQPWMTLGWQMTAAGFALQARMTKAALSMPPATAAMRQGAEALNAWFTLMQTRSPKARKD